MFGWLKKMFRPASADFAKPAPVEFRWEERVESRPVEPAPVPAVETVTNIEPTMATVSTEVKTEEKVEALATALETEAKAGKKAKKPKATKTSKPRAKKAK